MSVRPVYIYHPRGDYSRAVHDLSYQGVVNALFNAGVPASRQIELTDSSYLNRELTSEGAGILAIPGGRTMMLSLSLANSIEKINNAILKNGWNYLGFCSGGALACSRLTHDNPDMIDFSSTKVLDLLRGTKAVYPVFDITYGTYNGRLTPVRLESLGLNFDCFWNEGNSFSINPSIENYFFTKRVVVYTDSKLPKNLLAAMIMYNGSGKIGALGIHPEIDDSGEPVARKPDPSEKPTDPNALGRELLLEEMFSSLNII